MGLHEEPDAYVVEAEVPGFKKEDIQIHVGDSGRSIVIEGKSVSGNAPASARDESESTRTDGAIENKTDKGSAVTRASDASTTVSVEGSFLRDVSFSRTVWLPRPVDGNTISAKLADGVLTLRAPKKADDASIKVNID